MVSGSLFDDGESARCRSKLWKLETSAGRCNEGDRYGNGKSAREACGETIRKSFSPLDSTEASLAKE